jgi:hypothetical protein
LTWARYHERHCQIKLRLGCTMHFPECLVIA